MIRKIYLIAIACLLTVGNTSAQHLNSENGGYESKRIINNKKFRVIYNEIVIDKTVDEVWKEVAGNFMTIDKVVKDVNFTKCLSGDTLTGLGAKRLCNLNNQGKTVEIKEVIIDYKECGDHREFTYFVYDSPGVPLTNYATWVVRKGKDGKTYLGSAFIFRANFNPLTGIIANKLKKGALKVGVWSYKHYLETGEQNVDTEKLKKLYSK